MTQDALYVVVYIFKYLWQFFTSWYIPGTRVTPAAFAFFLLMANVILRIIQAVFRSKSATVSGGVKSVGKIRDKS